MCDRGTGVLFAVETVDLVSAGFVSDILSLLDRGAASGLTPDGVVEVCRVALCRVSGRFPDTLLGSVRVTVALSAPDG